MKKRLRLNFIDITLVLLIAAVVLTAYFLSHDSSDEVNTVSRTYVIAFSDTGTVRIGDAVTDAVRGSHMGTVAAVEPDPDSGILRVTVEAETVEDEKGVSTVSGCSIRVGTEVTCTIGSLTASGCIVGLSR